MQIIPADWQSKTQLHIVTMSAAADAAQKFGPGADFERGWDRYEATCHDFLDYIERHFESDEGFDQFLQSEVRTFFNNSDDVNSTLENFWPQWHGSEHAVRRAEALSARFRIHFEEMFDLVRPLQIVGVIKPARGLDFRHG